MTHKRYNLVDNAYLQLANAILPWSATINIVFPTTYTWNKPLPADNWIGTLVNYGVDGNPSKMEKVYVTATSGTTLTVTRGYLWDWPQSFDVDDYLLLNVVAEHLDDIHMRIDEVETSHQGQLTDIYANGDHRLRVYRETGDPAFQVKIGAWTYRVGTAEWQYAWGTLTVWASVTTYVMINSSWVIQTSTSSWNGQYARLATVTSNGSGITAISLWKNDVVGWEVGVDWFQNITSTTYTRGILTWFVADGITWTLVYKRGNLYTASNWSNTWTANYSNGRLTTTSKT